MRALVVLLVGCARFDPGEPIELVPDSRWSAPDVARLEAAAECWNIAFATQLVVTRDPSTPQAAFVAYDDFACVHAESGQYTPGVPARIDVCPPGHYDGVGWQPPLFMTLIHELGHAVGIRVEGTGDVSVMGQCNQSYYVEVGKDTYPAFSDEDRSLFYAESPDYRGAGCASTWMQTSETSGVECSCL